MPTYAYRCFDCGHEFEEMQRISDPAITLCPKCGNEAVKRLISATSFHLKGSGWYKTDYASSSSSAPPKDGHHTDSSASSTSSSEAPAKTEAKSDTAKATESAPAAPAASTTGSGSSGSSE